MRLTYDPDADAAVLYFSGAAEHPDVARTDFGGGLKDHGSVNLLFDADDRLVGFEILKAAASLGSDVLAQVDCDDERQG